MHRNHLDDDEEDYVSDEQLIAEISKLITQKTGVLLGKAKSNMVSARIQKRAIQLGLNSLQEYTRFLRKNPRTEISALVSLLTTHHTFFFREFAHFEYLSREGVARVVDGLRERGGKKLRIWSAACSRGHEAYSIAMLMEHLFKDIPGAPEYEILGTDIDPVSVKVAKDAVFQRDDLKEVPAIYLANHWARGKGEISSFVKARDSIKKKTQFHTMNLKEIHASPLLREKFDIIFCRNVFIYFEPAQILKIIGQMRDLLNPGGLLVLGLSEPVSQKIPDLNSLGHSIYAHVPRNFVWKMPAPPLVPPKKKAKAAAEGVASEPAEAALSRVLRVLCVDDSATITSLLKTILTEEAGFKIVGTAVNGIEAARFLKKNEVDLVTLDIHMPEQNGIEYLEANMSDTHPPVVMVTSVSREDASTAQRALKLGAADIVEKPSILHLQQQGPELITKLRTAWLNRGKGGKPQISSVDKQFTVKESSRFKKGAIRILIAPAEERSRVKSLLKLLAKDQTVTLVLLHGRELDLFSESVQISLSGDVSILETTRGISNKKPGETLLGSFETVISDLPEQLHKNQPVSVMVLGKVPPNVELRLKAWSLPQLIVEDVENSMESKKHPLLNRADFFVPLTSFIYHSDRHLKE